MTQLKTKDATAAARAFMRQYGDIPSFAFPKPRQYLPMDQSRIYEICYGCMQTHQEYVLMVIRVKDDGSVSISEDRREVVRAMLKQKGVTLPATQFAEGVCAHFERAVHEPGAEYPDWIVGIRMDDGDQHDAIATIRKTNGDKADVPLCVFRSSGHKAAFFSRFQGDPSTRIAVTMKVTATPAQIREYLIGQLEKRRKSLDARDSAA